MAKEVNKRLADHRFARLFGTGILAAPVIGTAGGLAMHYADPSRKQASAHYYKFGQQVALIKHAQMRRR